MLHPNVRFLGLTSRSQRELCRESGPAVVGGPTIVSRCLDRRTDQGVDSLYMEGNFRDAKSKVMAEDVMQATGLDRLNAADDDEARALLLACAAVPRWADEVVRGRPYASVEAVLDAARTMASPWTGEEIDAALSRHPRIGERAEGGERDALHSRREQAGVAGADGDVRLRLAEGNRVYEERFGHVFLIRAAGRGPEEILAALDERLGNDPATERRIAADQLREIAVLRLEGELS